jgi:1-aminocyclopropane-1-carboxylate deaminase
MRLHEFPRHPLTFGPSPLQHLRRLSNHLGGAQVWAKREDVNSGLAFGGNKVRKLEYIVPDVLASGADTLVSIGGYQSNHTRAVAAVAAHLGLKARLVQEKWVPWDDPVNDKVGNILLSRMMGADSRLDPAGFDIGIRDSWKDALREVEESGGTAYPIPPVPPSTRSAVSASRTGRSRSPSRRRRSGCTSTPSSCAPSPARPTPG